MKKPFTILGLHEPIKRDYEISVFTKTHLGKEQNTQVFKSIKLRSPTTVTFDGDYFTD